MEARVTSEAPHGFYGARGQEHWVVGKRSMEWDLNDWKWDGDLFVASSLKNTDPSSRVSREFFPIGKGENASNSSSSCSDEVNLGVEMGKDSERKRRVIVIDDDDPKDEEVAGTLSLKLGGDLGGTSEKSKVVGGGGSASRTICQVQDCEVDLSNAKDYHRRHKVCEMHSKATKALVGNVMQRFCQQCSRFHVLEEFDEGKRSCRRRLAGHNKRRRKTNPEPICSGSTVNNDQNSNFLLISLLRILSNMHSSKLDKATDQDLLSQFLKNLASQAVEHEGRNLPALLQNTRHVFNAGTSQGNSEKVPPDFNGATVDTTSSVKARITNNNDPMLSGFRDSTAGQVTMNNFDLNDVYVNSDDERSPTKADEGTAPLAPPSLVHQESNQLSPPRTSRNSDSVSAQSPSSSSGDPQSRTDRIVFKLFGKEPNDFPLVLRTQILDWLSHSPTDIESYIRPGCVVLTIYLRQTEAAWDDLCCDLSSNLSCLLGIADDTFWQTGWVYMRVQDQIVFVYNGQVVIDRYLPLSNSNCSKILSVKPIATSSSDQVQFVIKGIHLSRPATRLLCAIEGQYVIQEDNHNSMVDIEGFREHDEVQCVNFSCSIPAVAGRGFIEIEDYGFSSSFFPFIVAEEDVCSEIRKLEVALDSGDENMDAKNQAMEFIHEMGWLLHRSQVKSRLDHLDPNTELFPLRRFKWLIDFCMDNEWCSVLRKLLNVIMINQLVSIGDYSTVDVALSEMGLLHRAVRKSSRSLVELLLRYVPQKLELENEKAQVGLSKDKFLFTPNIPGPAGLTPLHIAAGRDGAEDVLDALTNDPEMVGLRAWKNARDSTGFTPEDYARLRGHYSYIHLVQRKINKRPVTDHVVVDIPCSPCHYNEVNKKQTNSFEIRQTAKVHLNSSCELCTRKLAYGGSGRSMLYRPAMLSMVAIAAVCVCVALLFKSSPEVLYIFRPFRWEMLEYGSS